MKHFAATLILLVLSVFCLAQPINHWETAVFAGDTWKYHIPSAEPASTWKNIGFSDASWSTGPGGIGYADGDDATVIPSTLSLYLRKTFTLTDTSKILKAVLNADYDDAFIAYLNGVEIARSNIGAAGSFIPYNQPADGNREAQVYAGGDHEYYTINKTLLKTIINNGTNVLAIQVHNQSAGSSDLSSLFYLSLGINDASTDYSPTPTWFVPPFEFTDSNLPIMVINTLGQTIVDDPRIVVDMGLIYNGVGIRNYLTDPYNNYNGKINIEIRGSSSAGFPKKAYSFETQDSLNNAINVSLLGLPSENDWVLYAPYSEKTMLNNYITYRTGMEMGHYASRCKFIEVVLNGEYQGVYILMEKIKIDNNRVDIANLNPADTTGDELTGGYILKVDKFTGGADYWTSPYAPYTGATQQVYFIYHDPDYVDLMPQQRTYIQNFMSDFENNLAGASYDDPLTGYVNYIDVNSFIDYMIVNEFTRNVDGYRLSTFFHKDKDSKGGKINMGPLWDFNLGLGNADYCDGGLTTGWAYMFRTVCGGDWYQIPFWWERLMSDVNYQNKLKCRYDYWRTTVLDTAYLFGYIDSTVAVLDESQTRNFTKWPILGTYVWPNNYIGATYEDEVNYLKYWIGARLNWLDDNIPGTCITTEVPEIKPLEEMSIFPNPASDHFMIRYAGSEHPAQLKLFDATGKLVLNQPYSAGMRIEVGPLNTGFYQVELSNQNGILSKTKLCVAH